MTKIIKLQDIADRVHFSLENAQKLVELFYVSSNDILEKMETAIGNDDYEQIYKSAHSLKGSASNLLFHEVYDISKEMESAAKDQLSFEYTQKLHEIREILKETKVI